MELRFRRGCDWSITSPRTKYRPPVFEKTEPINCRECPLNSTLIALDRNILHHYSGLSPRQVPSRSPPVRSGQFQNKFPGIPIVVVRHWTQSERQQQQAKQSREASDSSSRVPPFNDLPKPPQ